jgi:hypothetical protein
VLAACADAKRAKPNENIGPAYVIAILERWAKEAAALHVGGARKPQTSHSQQDSRAAAAASIGMGGTNRDAKLIIDAEE